MASLILLRRLDRLDVTAHGFGSSFRDWAAETTHYQNHVVEMALAHSIGNAVEAAYRRGDQFDKRRELTADWGKFCSAARPALRSSQFEEALATSRFWAQKSQVSPSDESKRGRLR